MTLTTASYYDGPDLLDRVRDDLVAAGLDPNRLDVADLAALDQFHGLGLAATLALAELADVAAGERVLDIGAGIAGPARILTTRWRARVTAVEPLARFRRLGEALNAATGIQVEMVAADGFELPFDDGSFELVWTQAVLQSVSDLAALAREAHRVLKPGGRWALAELAAGPGGPIVFPVPWGDSERDSHLLAPGALRDTLERPGFAAEIWQVGPEAVAGALGKASAEPARSDPPITLAALVPNFQARMEGMARNLAEQRVLPVQGVLRRSL